MIVFLLTIASICRFRTAVHLIRLGLHLWVQGWVWQTPNPLVRFGQGTCSTPSAQRQNIRTQTILLPLILRQGISANKLDRFVYMNFDSKYLQPYLGEMMVFHSGTQQKWFPALVIYYAYHKFFLFYYFSQTERRVCFILQRCLLIILEMKAKYQMNRNGL